MPTERARNLKGLAILSMRFYVCYTKKTGNYICPNSFIQFWCAFKIVCLCGVYAFSILEVLDICLGPAIYQLSDTSIDMNQTEVVWVFHVI